MQLQDYDQQQLMPVPVNGRPEHDVEPLDASMAGRAFTTHGLLHAARPDGVRMWTAMLDGTDRVGVLRVTADTDDAPTRHFVQRLAGLVADLIVTKGAYTDVFFQLRRRRPVSLQAEMQWHLLPPLVMTTPQVSVAGALEPALRGRRRRVRPRPQRRCAAPGDPGRDGPRTARRGDGRGRYRRLPARPPRRSQSLEEIYLVMDSTVAAHVTVEEFVTAQVAELAPPPACCAGPTPGTPPRC